MRCSVTIPTAEFDKYEKDPLVPRLDRQQRKLALMQAFGVPLAGMFHDHSLALQDGLLYRYGLNDDASQVTIYWSRVC